MKELVCIVCPQSCHLKIDADTMQVSGNKCARGKNFAIAELTKPMRTISSCVATTFSDVPVLPVKVSAEIPKDSIMSVMRCINKVVLDRRVACGDVIIENVLNLGVDVVATSNILS